jgi:two-component system chemotaxis response regulator CheB
VEPGRIYVAPPDRHLLVQEGHVRLGHGPRQNGHRPSADALFRSAALAYGPRVIALVLSGTLDDGASGAQAVAQRGGVVAVQDPDEATYPGMPNSVVRATGTKLILPVDQLAELITRLVGEEVGEPFDDEHDADLVVGNELMLLDEDLEEPRQGMSEPSAFVCPDCGGTLYHTKSLDLGPFRCRIGHAWSPGALLAQQSQAVENALWAALRTLQERADLSRRLAEPARKRGHLVSADMFDAAAAEADRAAISIRAVLSRRDRGFSAVHTDEAT